MANKGIDFISDEDSQRDKSIHFVHLDCVSFGRELAMQYVYKHTIRTCTACAYGFESTQETSDNDDFNSNHKSDSILVTEVVIEGTHAIVFKTYAGFSSLITGSWTSVLYTDSGKEITLFLFSDTAL